MSTDRRWLKGEVTFQAAELGALPAKVASLLVNTPVPQQFFEYFSADGSVDVLTITGGTEIVRFGYGRSRSPIGLDVRTLEVAALAGQDWTDVPLVNSSLDRFVDFMSIAEERYPYYTDEEDLEITGAFSESLYAELKRIDPAAFSDWSYWSTFVGDVGNGDYAEVDQSRWDSKVQPIVFLETRTWINGATPA